MSLSINEMVLLNIKEEEIDWDKPDYEKLNQHLFYVQKLSFKSRMAYMFFRFHRDAAKITEPVSKTAGSFKGIKVNIDRIGRVYKAHD